MVEWIRKKDGSWEYRFDIFDKWVEFMFSCGITEQISCFSIAPWDASFRYFDEATGEYVSDSERAYGSFYVLRSYVDKIISDAQRLLDGKEVTANTKY
jgi:hypothetical protein